MARLLMDEGNTGHLSLLRSASQVLRFF